MTKPNVAKLFKSVQTTLVKHSPEILVGFGITGMITTTVLAVKATPKALMLIEEEKRRQNRHILEEAKKNGETTCAQVSRLNPWETVKATWKCYIPAAITGTASIACVLGANSVNAQRNAALAAAYKLSETALTEYKEKVVETIGEKKEQTVRDKIAEDRLEKNPVNDNEVHFTGRGDTLFYDHWSGRFFKSDIDQIKKAENRLNKQMLHDMGGYVSLNDFYDEIGLEQVGLGEYIGWNTDRGLMDVDVTHAMVTEDGRPCIVLDHNTRPQYGYSGLY